MTLSKVRTRFAPSPTGYLHVGGARTALFNWLYARHCGGQFVLRIEDTDQNRNIEEGIDAILGGLRWLGMDWDEGPEAGGDRGPYFQSQRQDLYDKHLETLQKKDVVYSEENGAVRFRSPRQPVVVDDQICGRVEFLRDEPDMTIRRPDGSYIFHFVNVVDDLEMGITHVIRGEDHLSNTPKHIELFQALDAPLPVYAHIPLILNLDGSKMSKRDMGASLKEYQAKAYLPEALVNYLSLLGWSPKDDREILNVDEITALFDFPGINQSNASFDLTKLGWLNGQRLMALDAEDFWNHAAPVVQAAGMDLEESALRKILPLVQKKVTLASEIPLKIGFFQGDYCDYDSEAIAKMAKDPANEPRLQALIAAFEAAGDWTEDSIGAAIDTAAANLEVKQGKLMFPARVAASGQLGGPDLLPMLALLGQERVLLRFREAAGKLD
jgi:glutamyl-tRNA synthetase